MPWWAQAAACGGFRDAAPGSRVLDGRFMSIEQTIASPKGRDDALLICASSSRTRKHRYGRGMLEKTASAAVPSRSLNSDCHDSRVRGGQTVDLSSSSHSSLSTYAAIEV